MPDDMILRLALGWYSVKRLRDYVAHLSPPRLPAPPFSAISCMWAHAKLGAVGMKTDVLRGGLPL